VPVFAFLIFSWTPVWTFLTNNQAAVAGWAQALVGALAICTSVWVATSVQRRDHRNQLRGAIEVAVEVARYARLAVEKTQEAFPSRDHLRLIAEGKEYFDVGGVTSIAKITSELPVHELKNGDAVRHMVSLGQMVRQLDAHVQKALSQHQRVDGNAFEEFHQTLAAMHANAQRTVDGLIAILRETK